MAKINQPQGPRTGNAGTASKRKDFKESKLGNGMSELADMVVRALGMRGDGMKPKVNPALENINSNSAKTTGISKNVTADGARLPGKYKRPNTKGNK